MLIAFGRCEAYKYGGSSSAIRDSNKLMDRSKSYAPTRPTCFHVPHVSGPVNGEPSAISAGMPMLSVSNRRSNAKSTLPSLVRSDKN